MSIKEEFDKAFESKFEQSLGPERLDSESVALWAAKWMAERCAKIVDSYEGELGELWPDTCVGISKIIRDELNEI